MLRQIPVSTGTAKFTLGKGERVSERCFIYAWHLSPV